MKENLRSKLIFMMNFVAYDFTKTTGQYALEINYSNGDKDMFTTPMKPGVGSDKGDFKDEKEFFETVSYLKLNNIHQAG